MFLQGDIFCYTFQSVHYAYQVVEEKQRKISADEYCQAQFGQMNPRLKRLSGSIGESCIYDVHFQRPDLLIYDRQGGLLEKRVNFFDGYSPYGLVVLEDRQEVWVATASGQVVLCFSLETGETMFQMGTPYSRESVCQYPEDIFFYQGHLYISEMGNKQVVRLSVESKERKVYLQLEEPVWWWMKNESLEIVGLDSGAYLIGQGGLEKLSLYQKT